MVAAGPEPSRAAADAPRRRGPARWVRALLRRLGALIAFGITAAGVTAIAVIVTRHQLANPDHARFPIRGIDVSHHQGHVDWPKVAGARVRFAYIKASEGADHRDREFPRNWHESQAAGLARGAYHYFTFCTPGAAQAAHFVRVVPPGQRMLPPAVDVEYAGNCANPPPAETIRRELDAMLQALARAYGRKPVIYTTNEARVRLLRGAFDAYPIWIRNVYAPPWLLGVSGWAFWQHDDEGRLAGVATPVDMNVFHGDAEGLDRCVSTGDCAPPLEAPARADSR